ncbi:hypothetical protein J4N45_11050 [Vibrio sp. SCSIO 43140]|uniref:hypothetical protein n=1 Tax=Vibrio sp. SCSIO 43140 TaxID=2819100 RepID=UPI002074DC93|nr:hypothetical protein [Vibrio sp. SCSIO 43140]USD59068.1 hypothetical protein J4N45_11050 [Vibrio sp. SCSIO 43140]
MSSNRNCSISGVEGNISSEEHLVVRVFLSCHAAIVSLIVGVCLIAVSQLAQGLFLDTLPLSVSSPLGLMGVLILAYGLIVLANYDSNWGKLTKKGNS